LISQPNGITDAVAGSTFDLAGTFNAGGNSGFANLNSVEGTVNLYGQSFTDTPGSGTLTNTGTLTANSATALTISGNVNNSGLMATGANDVGGSTLTITGTLTNNSGGTFELLGAGDMASLGNGMSNAGLVDVDNSSKLQITGNVNNSGTLETSSYYGTGNNTITITGGLTNSGDFFLRQNGDVANMATLTNTGYTSVATGATLNLTSQPNGITDAVAGSRFDLLGTFNAGGNAGFANLNSVEGGVNLYGQSFTDTPGSGTLTISNAAALTVNYNSGTGVGTALTISGDVNNSGLLATGYETSGGNTLAITGMLSNNSGGTFDMIGAGDKGSIGNGMTNAGVVDVDNGSTLKITGNVNNSGTLET